LVRRYHRAVRQSIGFLSGARSGRVSAADVEDAVQQTFLTIFNDEAAVLRRWAGRSSLRTYLCRIAERVGIRHFQRLLTRHGRFRLDLDAPTESGTRIERVEDTAEAAPERMIADEARTEARQQIIAKLSEKGRQYYDYLFVQELDVAAIAEREQTNPNNVYQWKNRIVRVARSVLVELGYVGARKENARSK
jgi:RNA polymerase sigma factor (sigma-70 family)